MTAPTFPAEMPRVPLLERWEIGFSEDRMREYGLQCYEAGRTAGLEDAARECDALAGIEGIAQRCADAIRSVQQGMH